MTCGDMVYSESVETHGIMPPAHHEDSNKLSGFQFVAELVEACP